MISPRLLQFVTGCELIDFGEIIETDHRDFAVDFDLKTYFKIEIESLDNIDYSKLDSSRLSYYK